MQVEVSNESLSSSVFVVQSLTFSWDQCLSFAKNKAWGRCAGEAFIGICCEVFKNVPLDWNISHEWDSPRGKIHFKVKVPGMIALINFFFARLWWHIITLAAIFCPRIWTTSGLTSEHAHRSGLSHFVVEMPKVDKMWILCEKLLLCQIKKDKLLSSLSLQDGEEISGWVLHLHDRKTNVT